MNRRETVLCCGTLVLSLVIAVPALAQNVEARLANQADRISSGIRDGSLTAGEDARLEREQSAIAREEQRFKADGTFTPGERQKVAHGENRLSRQIYRQRHDDQGRR